MDFTTMEKLDILNINKRDKIVYVTPYNQTYVKKRMRQEWLELILTPIFIFIFATFILYHIQLPSLAYMGINLSGYVRKEINITYNLDE